MKALVIYDSVSDAKVTKKVAETVQATLNENGVQTSLMFVDDAAKANLKDYDAVVFGAPTMAWRPSKKMKDYLAGLKNEYAGKKAATFDTQMDSAISGNANKHMEKDLKAAGFTIVGTPLLAYVTSVKKVYTLNDGQLDKIKNWSKDLADILKK
ncbi:MAG: flavodoxin [Methanomassiliicoccales archaeon PtaU1.Bin124]|nr:MAG: flavodoxin [Methanomassiliicoccales archaeon PtaU1.Bin124]